MARIPLGDFGQVVARPGPQVSVSPAAFGAAEGRALEQVGAQGMQIAGHDIAVANAEAAQRQREEIAQARQAAQEAARVKQITARATVVNGLKSITSEIDNGLNDGTVDKSKAGEIFAARSKKLVDESLKDIDPQHQELVRSTLLEHIGDAQRSVAAGVVRRDRADILAGGMQFTEQMQRFALAGPKEADQAIANLRAFWPEMGPKAGEDAAKTAARLQQAVEKIRFTQATALVNADPGAAMKALKDPNYLPELDPQQRTSLIQTADVRVTQAASRAEIAAAAAERRMQRAWEADRTIFEAGKAPTPEYAAERLKFYKGTQYESAFREFMGAAPAQAAFASAPIASQQRLLDELQGKMNREGATPELVKRYNKLETAHKAAVAELKADPYAAAAERGVIKEIAPLSLDIKTLPQQLGARARDAAQVSQWAGEEVSLFRPQEAEKVAEVLGAMNAKDRAGAISLIAKQMTPGQMRALGKQFGSKDETLSAAAMLAAQGAKTETGRMSAEWVLYGADAIKEKRVKWPAGQDETTVRAEIDQITRGAFLSEAAQRAAGDAALAAYAGLLVDGKLNNGAKQAVGVVTGGIMEQGGQKIVKPYGWTDGMVLKALRDIDAPKVASLTGGQLVRLGDKELDAEGLAKLMPGAQLGPTGKPGAYTVSFGGRMVMVNGRPLLVPLER